MEADRPASILSPNGEGYCRYCRFVVGLDDGGLLDRHARGAILLSALAYGTEPVQPPACKGSGTLPPKITPYRSAKSAFKAVPRKTLCPRCLNEVRTEIGASGHRTYVRHHQRPGYICPLSGNWVVRVE